MMANVTCILAAVGFVIGGAGILFSQPWGALRSWPRLHSRGASWLLFWNGRLEHLDSPGGVGLLINLALLIAVVVFRVP